MFLNQLKTAILLGTLSGILLLFGYWAGGSSGVIVMFLVSLALNFFTYYFSDRIVLAMYGAKTLDRAKFSSIYEMVQELCFQAKIPMPNLYYISSPMANAFATGRNPNNASVAVTQGILDILDENELRGVLAHEISHVKNRDILVGTIAATIATAIGYLAHILQWSVILGGHKGRNGERSGGAGALLAAVFMPLAATLLQLAISRSREYLADESGAKMCHDPLALASALEKLHSSSQRKHMHPESEVQAATASLFIVYPFSLEGVMNLFSTHPPMEKRIERLRRMAR